MNIMILYSLSSWPPFHKTSLVGWFVPSSQSLALLSNMYYINPSSHFLHNLLSHWLSPFQYIYIHKLKYKCTSSTYHKKHLVFSFYGCNLFHWMQPSLLPLTFLKMPWFHVYFAVEKNSTILSAEQYQ